MALDVVIGGLGKMGQHYLENVPKIPGFQLKGVCDSDAASDHPRDIPLFEDYECMLRKTDPDLVIIATPEDLHTRMLLKAVELGAHVLVEKPVCLNSEEIVQLRGLTAKTDRKIAVNYLTRFSPALHEARQFISNRLLSPSRYDIKWSKNRLNDGRKNFGVLRQEGTHALDLLLYSLLGERDVKVSTQVALHSKADDREHETDADFALQVGGTLVRMIMSYQNAVSKRHISIYCREKGEDRYCVFLGFDKKKEQGLVDVMAINDLRTGQWHNYQNEALRKTRPGRFRTYQINKLLEQLYTFQRWVTNDLYDSRICTLPQALTNIELCRQILDRGKTEPTFTAFQRVR